MRRYAVKRNEVISLLAQQLYVDMVNMNMLRGTPKELEQINHTLNLHIDKILFKTTKMAIIHFN